MQSDLTEFLTRLQSYGLVPKGSEASRYLRVLEKSEDGVELKPVIADRRSTKIDRYYSDLRQVLEFGMGRVLVGREFYISTRESLKSLLLILQTFSFSASLLIAFGSFVRLTSLSPLSADYLGGFTY